MKNLFYFFFLFFFSVLGIAQENNIDIFPDSIIDKEIIQNRLLNYKSATDLILSKTKKNPNAYRVSAFIDIIQFRFTSAKEKIKVAIVLDSINNNKLNLSENYNILARYYKDLQKNDSALVYYKKAIAISSKYNKKKYTGRYLENLGSFYGLRGKKDSAMVFLKEAGQLSKAAKDTLSGLILYERETNLLKKANHDLKSSLNIIKYGKIHNNNFLQAWGFANAGKYYMSKKDSINFAIKYLDSAITFFENTKNIYFLNTVYPSRAYLAKKDTITNTKAIDIYEKQLKTVKNTGHIFEGMTMINLAGEYAKSGKVEEAERINKSIIALSKKREIQKILIAIAHENLSSIYENQKRYKEALSEYKELYKNETQAYSIQVADQANKYKIEFETIEKEKENLQLKADKAQQSILLAQESKRKWQLGAGLLTALIALAVFTFYYRRNKKQKVVIESLQKELHHRIKNNLSIIDTFIEVAKEEFEDPKFSKKLTELQNRIDSINEVHQQLYKNKDVTNLNLKNYIDTLAKNVESSFSNDKITIEKTVKDQLHLQADKSFPVGLIINEFLTNSYKYAFDSNEGKVKIEMNDLGSDYQLLLSDNGKGLPENFDLKTSDTFGLRIMKLLTEQLNGDFQLSNDHGVNLTINFPK